MTARLADRWQWREEHVHVFVGCLRKHMRNADIAALLKERFPADVAGKTVNTKTVAQSMARISLPSWIRKLYPDEADDLIGGYQQRLLAGRPKKREEEVRPPVVQPQRIARPSKPREIAGSSDLLEFPALRPIHICQWPIETDDGPGICGKVCRRGTSYCEDHASTVYQSSEKREIAHAFATSDARRASYYR